MTEIALLKILVEQQEEAQQWLNHSPIIHRDKTETYQNLLQDPLIKVITGVRRSGKSFLSLQALPPKSWIYVNFDDERLSEMTSEDLNKIYSCGIQINEKAQFWVLDEIQNIKSWDLFVNRLQRKGLNLVITGSNGKLLSKELSTHLTGRHLSFEMFPLSFSESLDANIKNENGFNKLLLTTEIEAKIKSHFSEYLKLGGFPEVRYIVNKSQYLRELYNSVLTRDIIQRYSLRSPTALKALAKLLLNNISKEFSYKKLSESGQLGSMNTAKKYVSYLNDCYLYFELEFFSPKIKERLNRERKVYCIDTGIYNSIQTSISENIGAQLENCIFIELLRREKEIFYIKDPKFEIDFAITKNRKIIELIQVCYDMSIEKTRNREIQALVKASNQYRCEKLAIITLDEENIVKVGDKTISVIPAWKWLLQK